MRTVAVWRLGLAFLKLGAMAFGGGYALLPLLEAELVRRRGWQTLDQVTDAYSLGQSVPGVIAINAATLLGWRLGGWRGAGVAAVAAALPAFVIILLIALYFDRWQAEPLVQAVLWGVRPAVIALIVRAAWRLGRGGLRRAVVGLCSVLTLLGLLRWPMNPIVPILVAAVGGACCAWRAPAWTARRILAPEPPRG